MQTPQKTKSTHLEAKFQLNEARGTDISSNKLKAAKFTSTFASGAGKIRVHPHLENGGAAKCQENAIKWRYKIFEGMRRNGSILVSFPHSFFTRKNLCERKKGGLGWPNSAPISFHYTCHNHATPWLLPSLSNLFCPYLQINCSSFFLFWFYNSLHFRYLFLFFFSFFAFNTTPAFLQFFFFY